MKGRIATRQSTCEPCASAPPRYQFNREVSATGFLNENSKSSFIERAAEEGAIYLDFGSMHDQRGRFRNQPRDGRSVSDDSNQVPFQALHKDCHPLGAGQVFFEDGLEITEWAVDQTHMLSASERYRTEMEDIVCAPGANAIDYRLRHRQGFETHRDESGDPWHVSHFKKLRS